MGKSAPAPPPTPDPQAVARAQGEADLNTAVGNVWMGNANENTPYGNVRYNQIGTQTTPKGDEVPIFERNVTLSPGQQQLFDQQQALGVGLNNLALDQTGRIGNLLSSPIDASALQPPRASAPDQPQFQGGPGTPGFQSVFLSSLGGAGPIQSGLYLANTATGFSDAGALQRGVNMQQASGNIADAGDFARNVNLGNAATSFGGAGDIQRSIGPTDYEQSRSSVEDAIYSRLNPQLDRDRDALETRLVNQGFQRGSDAFMQEMDAFNRQANDARMQAVLAGGSEQSRLAQLALQSGQFANQAQQQAFGQELTRGEFGNQAVAQNNQAALAAAQYGQGAQQQAFNQALGRSQFEAGIVGQNNAANLAGGQFANDAQRLAYEQALGRGQFGMQAVAQNNQAALAAGQFANQAQQQAFDQNAMQAAFNNDAQMQGASFNNQIAQQGYDNAFRNTELANQNALASYQAGLQSADFDNTSRQQALQEQLALRNQPINEITAMMSGGQVSMPQFSPYQFQPMPQVPVGQYTYQSADLAQRNYQSQLAAQNAMMGGLFGLGSAGLLGAMRFSDRRLKRDIVDLGIRLRNGIKLYAYRYAGHVDRRVGVMAEDVAAVVPAAVSAVAGYLVVDYDLLMEAA